MSDLRPSLALPRVIQKTVQDPLAELILLAGSHLDRKMDDLVPSPGFDLPELRTEYASGHFQ